MTDNRNTAAKRATVGYVVDRAENGTVYAFAYSGRTRAEVQRCARGRRSRSLPRLRGAEVLVVVDCTEGW